MEKRRLVRRWIVLTVLCAGIAAAVVFWRWNREIPLAGKYPAVADGQYLAAIMWAGEAPESIDSAVSNKEFQQILGSARVKKGARTQAAPDVEFFIRLYDHESQIAYSVEVGKDRSISVARLDDLEQSRTYWTDCEGDVFAKLYACHLQHGGAAIDP